MEKKTTYLTKFAIWKFFVSMSSVQLYKVEGTFSSPITEVEKCKT